MPLTSLGKKGDHVPMLCSICREPFRNSDATTSYVVGHIPKTQKAHDDCLAGLICHNIRELSHEIFAIPESENDRNSDS